MKGTVTVEFRIDMELETSLSRDNKLGDIVDNLNRTAQSTIAKKLMISEEQIHCKSTKVVLDGTKNIVTGV